MAESTSRVFCFFFVRGRHVLVIVDMGVRAIHTRMEGLRHVRNKCGVFGMKNDVASPHVADPGRKGCGATVELVMCLRRGENWLRGETLDAICVVVSRSWTPSNGVERCGCTWLGVGERGRCMKVLTVLVYQDECECLNGHDDAVGFVLIKRMASLGTHLGVVNVSVGERFKRCCRRKSRIA